MTARIKGFVYYTIIASGFMAVLGMFVKVCMFLDVNDPSSDLVCIRLFPLVTINTVINTGLKVEAGACVVLLIVNAIEAHSKRKEVA